jgi:hypothetical protein
MQPLIECRCLELLDLDSEQEVWGRARTGMCWSSASRTTWTNLVGSVAFESNHTDDRPRQLRLNEWSTSSKLASSSPWCEREIAKLDCIASRAGSERRLFAS